MVNKVFSSGEDGAAETGHRTLKMAEYFPFEPVESSLHDHFSEGDVYTGK